VNVYGQHPEIENKIDAVLHSYRAEVVSYPELGGFTKDAGSLSKEE